MISWNDFESAVLVNLVEISVDGVIQDRTIL